MHNAIDIAKVVAYLIPFKAKLSELYNWKVNYQTLRRLDILSDSEIDALGKLSPFQSELIVKEKVGQALKLSFHSNEEQFSILCEWIIKDWGGIKTGKNMAETMSAIRDFLRQSQPSFKRIASTSKIGAFLDPSNYLIYDARVAYTLNWIILSQDAGDLFFPVPEGRNSKMNAFDIKVLIRLSRIHLYFPKQNIAKEEKKFISQRDKKIFIPESNAYAAMQTTVKKIHEALWIGEPEKLQHLYFTEMLLFAMADQTVFMDILHHFSSKK